jgi:hypothetical protein
VLRARLVVDRLKEPAAVQAYFLWRLIAEFVSQTRRN